MTYQSHWYRAICSATGSHGGEVSNLSKHNKYKHKDSCNKHKNENWWCIDTTNPINIFFNISNFQVFASPITAIGVISEPGQADRAKNNLEWLKDNKGPPPKTQDNSNGVNYEGLEGREFILSFKSPITGCCNNVPALFLDSGPEPLCLRPVFPSIQGGLGIVFQKKPRPKFKVLVIDGAGNKLEKKLCLTKPSDQIECFPPEGTVFVGFTSPNGIVEIQISDIDCPGTAILYTVIGDRICPPPKTIQ